MSKINILEIAPQISTMNGPDYQGQFKLAPDNYLARNYIMDYLNDSVQQLLDIRNANPKIDVLEFFAE